MTNQVDQLQGWLVYLQDAATSVTTMGPEITCIIVCWICGVILKMCGYSKPRWFIPVALTFIIGPFISVILYETGFNNGAEIALTVKHVWVGKAIAGIELGFGTWLIHKVFLSKLTNRWLFDEEGNTKFLKKEGKDIV